MAIARMQKIGVAGHGSVRPAAIAALHRCGAVHISDMREYSGKEEWKDFVGHSDTADHALEEYLGNIRQVTTFLSRFIRVGAKKQPAQPVVKITRGEYEKIVADFNHRAAVERLMALEKEHLELETSATRIRQQKAHLVPWLKLDIPLRELGPTKNVDILMGIVSTAKVVQLDLGIRSATDMFHIEVVDQDEGLTRLIVFFSKEHESAILEAIKQVGFERVSFKEMGHVEGTPHAIVARLDCETAALKKRRLEIESELGEAADLRDKLIVIAEHVRLMAERARIQAHFATTPQAFLLEGWIRAADNAKVKEALAGIKEVEVAKLAPYPDEVPPTEYDNNEMIRPFEFVTDLYSRPCQQEVDPTPLFAPFLTLYFAICLTDAGYGLVLAIASYLILRKMRPGTGARKLFKVVFFGSIATVFVGGLTGGYFGVDFSWEFPKALNFLKAAREAILLLDPMKNPIPFWYVTLALGFIHIHVGLIIKIYKQAIQGRLLDGLLDQGAWVLVNNSAVLAGFGGIGLIPPFWGKVGLIGLSLGAAIILFFAGRQHKNIPIRLATGLYTLYGVTGFLGDVLSYSRLFALGLATGVLAYVVNTLASIAGDMIPYVGVVVAVVILVVGHTFTILINALGGFIHSTRLQFVEYFGKFYDGGGEMFKPFSQELEQVIILEGNA